MGVCNILQGRDNNISYSSDLGICNILVNMPQQHRRVLQNITVTFQEEKKKI